MKVGIVGSSYSVGMHHNPDGGDPLALPFEKWLYEHTDGIEFFNSACAGKGSELYLNKLVYLKQKHDIDAMLIEFAWHRSSLNFRVMQDSYAQIQTETDLSVIEDDVYRDSASAWEYLRSITQPMNEPTFAVGNDFETWKEVQWNITAIENSQQFWGLLDTFQVINLCKMLNVKPILWSFFANLDGFPSFKNLKSNTEWIQFNEYGSATDYYTNKYSKEAILCDHTHFNDATNNEMIKDFIAPKLTTIKEQLCLT